MPWGDGDSAVPATGEPGASAASAPDSGTRELLEVVFESSPAGLAVLVGPELRVVAVNPALRALQPDPGADLLGRTFEEAWPAADPRAAAALRRALETGEGLCLDDYAVPAAPRPRRLTVHARRVSWRGADALLVTAWETTPLWDARQAAEDAAQIAMRHAVELDAVFDAIADGFLLAGPGGEILRMNDEAKRLLPYTDEERRKPIGERFALLHATNGDGRPIPLEDAPLARALRGEIVRGVHFRVTIQERTRWLQASAAPVRAPEGVITGAVLTVSDETALHELEDARDDLVRMISHDLRTPLNAVYTQAHLIRRGPGDPARVEERARSIARSCERMSAMIQDLVEATLLEAGQLRLARVPVNLAALLPELVERLRGGVDVERVRVVVAPELPHIYADPHRLERIVTNLLTNALKYSPAPAEVTLDVAPADGGVALTVSDRGVGIAPEDLRHVFDRFFRARGARRPEGLGLGLYITRLLVEAHGGRIEVTSQLGQGSTFRILLPAALQPSPAPA